MFIALGDAETVPRHELEILVIHIAETRLHRNKLIPTRQVWRAFGLALVDLLDRRDDPPTPDLIDRYAAAVSTLHRVDGTPTP